MMAQYEIRMKEREDAVRPPSEVVTYKMAPAEIQAKYGHLGKNKDKIKPFSDLVLDKVKSMEEEKETKGEQKMESTVKRPRMDKQFFEDAFAEGKTLEDISKEQGVVYRIVKATASRVGAIENMSKSPKEAKEETTVQDVLMDHDILTPGIKGEVLDIKPPEISSEGIKIVGGTIALGKLKEEQKQGTFVKVNKEGTGGQIWSIIDRLAGFLDKDGTYDLVLELVEK